MTTARTELPYPCSPQAKTRGESSRGGGGGGGGGGGDIHVYPH